MNATHDLERDRHEITHAIHLETAFLAMLKLADFALVWVASGQWSPCPRHLGHARAVIVISDFSDTNFGEFVTQKMHMRFWNKNFEFDGFGHDGILPIVAE